MKSYKHKNYFLILSIFVFSSICFSELQTDTAITFEMMYNKPECAVEGKKKTFCGRADTMHLAEVSGIEAKAKTLIDLAQDKEKASITIAYFSFSNHVIFDALCEKGKAGFKVEGFFDSSLNTADSLANQLLKNCQSGPDSSNVRIHFLGSKSPWRLHHNKFLVVDSGTSNQVSLNFSSGNLSSFGLSVHFDHWVMMMADRSSNMVTQHQCVIEALRAAIDPDGDGKDETKDKPDVYRKTLITCLTKSKSLYSEENNKWIQQAINKEKIAPFFSPNPKDEIATALIEQIESVANDGQIFGCMQHFLHQEIAVALTAAAKRGVQVRLLMDDDVVNGDSEVPGSGVFYRRVLKPTEIKIRFMQTNAGDHQMMHNKFLVFKGLSVGDKKVARVFSGAGHFTKAGMTNNYENFYLSAVDSLTTKYTELFDYMNANSLSEDEVGIGDKKQ